MFSVRHLLPLAVIVLYHAEANKPPEYSCCHFDTVSYCVKQHPSNIQAITQSIGAKALYLWIYRIINNQTIQKFEYLHPYMDIIVATYDMDLWGRKGLFLLLDPTTTG